jgi:hypothetical protein
MNSTVRVKGLLLIALLMLGLSQTVPVIRAAQPQANNGTSTGQRIGNIISAAVSTAFPAVSSIIKAIWPPNGGTKKKSPSQVQAALQPQKDKSTQQEGANAQALSSAAKNLVVLRSFVTACGYASVQISAMQRLLADRSGSTITKADADQLTYLWTPAKAQLEGLTTQSVTSSVSTMDDDFLKFTLTEIQTAISNLSANIGQQIQNGSADDLRASLAELEPKLMGVTPLTGVLIGDLSSSLNTAADNISGHAGPSKFDFQAAAADRQRNLKILTRVYGKNEQ